jgi:hypothetical protein
MKTNPYATILSRWTAILRDPHHFTGKRWKSLFALLPKKAKNRATTHDFPLFPIDNNNEYYVNALPLQRKPVVVRMARD